jgi:hypothetical protein
LMLGEKKWFQELKCLNLMQQSEIRILKKLL